MGKCSVKKCNNQEYDVGSGYCILHYREAAAYSKYGFMYAFFEKTKKIKSYSSLLLALMGFFITLQQLNIMSKGNEIAANQVLLHEMHYSPMFRYYMVHDPSPSSFQKGVHNIYVRNEGYAVREVRFSALCVYEFFAIDKSMGIALDERYYLKEECLSGILEPVGYVERRVADLVIDSRYDIDFFNSFYGSCQNALVHIRYNFFHVYKAEYLDFFGRPGVDYSSSFLGAFQLPRETGEYYFSDRVSTLNFDSIESVCENLLEIFN